MAGYIVQFILNLYHISAAYGHPIPQWSIAIALCFLLSPLIIIKDISRLSAYNIVADIAIIAASLFIEIYCGTMVANNGINPTVAPYTTLYGAMKIIGLVTGAYEANGVLIPIYKQAENKDTYFRVQIFTLITVSLLYISFGSFGYLAYGEHVKGPITISLNQALWYVEVLELCYIAALLPSILLQAYPATKVITSYTISKMDVGKMKDVVENILKILLLLLCIWLGLLFGERFDVVSAFVGNLLCAPMSYVFPGFIHYRLTATTRGEKIRDSILMAFGLFCLVVATGLMVAEWFQ